MSLRVNLAILRLELDTAGRDLEGANRLVRDAGRRLWRAQFYADQAAGAADALKAVLR